MVYELYIGLGYGAFFSILGGGLLIAFMKLKRARKKSEKIFKN